MVNGGLPCKLVPKPAVLENGEGTGNQTEFINEMTGTTNCAGFIHEAIFVHEKGVTNRAEFLKRGSIHERNTNHAAFVNWRGSTNHAVFLNEDGQEGINKPRIICE